MKISRALFLKLVLCAGIGLMVSAPEGYAASAVVQVNNAIAGTIDTNAEEDAILAALIESLVGEDLDGITAWGEDFIGASEAEGGGESLTEAIMGAVLDKAVALGATKNQIDAITKALVAASGLQNAATLAARARSGSSGLSSEDMTRQQVFGDNPVNVGAPAGGNSLILPKGCSPDNLACIAAGNGISVEELQIRLNSGAKPIPQI